MFISFVNLFSTSSLKSICIDLFFGSLVTLFKIKLSPSFFHLTLNGSSSTDFILNSRELSYIISLYIVCCYE
nr:MAG TPA: hypothetical protein [Bacteriophage sp.]